MLKKWLTNFFSKNSQRLILLWIIVLSFLYSLLSVLKHNHFQSGGFDLGIYDQSVWQYSRFLSPYSTIKERFILGDHFTLTLSLLFPLFYIWDDARILLIFQAFFISFSTLAVYKLIIYRGFSPFIALSLSFIYSIFYGFQTLILFDFHPVVIGIGFLPWIAYFLETKRKRLLVLCICLLLLTQENMGITLTGLGLIYFFEKKYRLQAILFIIVGIITALISIRIVAFFSPIGYEYKPSIPSNAAEAVERYIDTPEKREVWLYSFGWYSFLPLFSPGSLLAVLIDLGQYFTTGEALKRMWGSLTHHRATLNILLLLGTLQILSFLKKKKTVVVFIVVAMLIVSCTFQYIFHFPLNKLSKSAYWKSEEWMEDNYKIFKIIPKTASLATQQNLVPHLSHRKEIYLLWPRKHEKEGWWLDFAGKPEYLLVNESPNQSIVNLLESSENFSKAIENMEKAGKISLVQKIGSAKLFKVKY